MGASTRRKNAAPFILLRMSGYYRWVESKRQKQANYASKKSKDFRALLCCIERPLLAS